jgi:hypothetical protein
VLGIREKRDVTEVRGELKEVVRNALKRDPRVEAPREIKLLAARIEN